jgi:hypothetical protein
LTTSLIGMSASSSGSLIAGSDGSGCSLGTGVVAGGPVAGGSVAGGSVAGGSEVSGTLVATSDAGRGPSTGIVGDGSAPIELTP